MLRVAARFAQVSKPAASSVEATAFKTPLSHVAEKVNPLLPAVHPGLEYTACKIFPGDVPMYKIPAQDGVEHKNYGKFTSKPFQCNYGPDSFDYGRLENPRGLMRIFMKEPHWTIRQFKYIGLMVLLAVPQCLAYDYFVVQAEAIGKKKGY